MSVEVPFPVFYDRNGEPLENGYIFIGQANLNPQTNPIQVFFDRNLTQLAAQPLRTLSGYISNAGTPAQVYVDAVNFSIQVQDKNGTMVYNFPDGTGISPDACGVEYAPPFVGGVPYPVCEKLAQTVSVKDFGAVGDGVANDQPACQAAIDAVIANGGGSVYFPVGTYLLTGVAGADSKNNGLLIPYSGSFQPGAPKIKLYGDGVATVLKANSANMYIIRASDSNVCIEQMALIGNSLAGTIGLGVVPESITQTSSIAWQVYSTFQNLFFEAMDNGIVLRTGPTIMGAASGCYYNVFRSLELHYNVITGVYIDSGPESGSSGSNRNSFINCHFGQGMTDGIVIRGADTTRITDCDFEGLAGTGIYIFEFDSYNFYANAHTIIKGCTFESVVTSINNNSVFTRLFGNTYDVNTWTFGKLPNTSLGNYDISIAPEIGIGFVNAGNPYLPGYQSGFINVTRPLCDTDGTTPYPFQLYSVTTSNTEFCTAINENRSHYTKLAGRVYWVIRVNWTAAVGNSGRFRIEFPINPNLDVYRLFGLIAPMVATDGMVLDGVTDEIVQAKFSDHSQTLNGKAYIEITHSSGFFQTSGPFNYVRLMVLYQT